jgi:hypothetical protein
MKMNRISKVQILILKGRWRGILSMLLVRGTAWSSPCSSSFDFGPPWPDPVLPHPNLASCCRVAVATGKKTKQRLQDVVVPPSSCTAPPVTRAGHYWRSQPSHSSLGLRWGNMDRVPLRADAPLAGSRAESRHHWWRRLSAPATRRTSNSA